SSFHLSGQPASPAPAQDPLMSLMLSQPRIDVESPVTPIALFDPPIIRAGDQAVYRVSFNALEESIDWPAKIPIASSAQMLPGGHGQMLGMVGPTLQPRTTFNFHVRVAEPGEITIPEFSVTVYGKPVIVPTAKLEVADKTSPPQPAAQMLV